MSIKPKDILPDDVNALEIKDVAVRKGTVAAALANAKILASKNATPSEKNSAMDTIKELIPALVALELHQHLTWKNAEIQQLIDAALAKQK